MLPAATQSTRGTLNLGESRGSDQAPVLADESPILRAPRDISGNMIEVRSGQCEPLEAGHVEVGHGVLENLHFGLCRVYLTATQDTTLPEREHPGPLIQDRFGSALKHSVCPAPNNECREECRQPARCDYAGIFKPTPAVVTDGTWMGDIPRPFVFEPYLPDKRHYARGEALVFNFLLIGTALGRFPSVVMAFQDMARFGLGEKAPARSPWNVERVVLIAHGDAPDGLVLFPAAGLAAQGPLPRKLWTDLVTESEQLSAEHLTLDLRTPLRVKKERRLVQQFDTETLVRALTRRISWLSRLWCGAPPIQDFEAQIKSWCSRIECQSENARWEDWTRHSTQRNRDLRLGGVRGAIVLRGELFRPGDQTDLRVWLKLGEYLHLGSQTVLGLGRYTCR